METSKKAGTRFRNLVDGWNFNAIMLLISTRILLLFYRLLHCQNRDGWRKTTEVHHRKDEAKYIGSLHNLAISREGPGVGKDPRQILIERLSNVFSKEPDLHFALKWKKHACYRVPHDVADIMEVEFDPSGKIDELKFYPDRNRISPLLLNENSTESLLNRIIEAYNETYLVEDMRRSILLYRFLADYYKNKSQDYPKSEVMSAIDRMLSATWVNFSESKEQPGKRMDPHFFTNQKHPGFGLLNVHCNYSADAGWLDIWMQFSHIGIDGRAASKLQRNIFNAFGSFDPALVFPADFRFSEKYFIYKYHDRDVFHGCCFIDFAPLLKYREELSARYGNVLPVSLLVWAMARHRQFKGIKFNVPVDIPAEGSKPRTVGFVFIKPGKYVKDKGGGESFREFNTSFNDQIKGLRRRSIENYNFMQTAVMTPHFILESMLRFMSSGLYAFTGESCVTFMDYVEYAIPSLSDNINSITAISLIPKNNNTMACVSVRAKKDTAKEMMEAVGEVVENIRDFAGIGQ